MIILKILQKINEKYQKVKLPMTIKDKIKKYLIFKLVMNVNMFCWKFCLFIFFDNLFKPEDIFTIIFNILVMIIIIKEAKIYFFISLLIIYNKPNSFFLF